MTKFAEIVGKSEAPDGDGVVVVDDDGGTSRMTRCAMFVKQMMLGALSSTHASPTRASALTRSLAYSTSSLKAPTSSLDTFTNRTHRSDSPHLDTVKSIASTLNAATHALSPAALAVATTSVSARHASSSSLAINLTVFSVT